MDLSFLSQTTPAPQLPDPIADYKTTLSLQDLARQNREGALKERQLNESDQATRDMRDITVRAQTVGWKQAIQEAAAAGKGQAVIAAFSQQKAQEKEEADVGKTKADAERAKSGAAKEKQQTEDLVDERLANEAHDLSANPNLTPDMVTTYMTKVAKAGRGERILSGVPQEAWTSVDGARAGLAQVGNIFRKTQDQVTAAETHDNNAQLAKDRSATRDQTAIRDDNTRKHQQNQDYNATQRLDRETGNSTEELTPAGMRVAAEMTKKGIPLPSGLGKYAASRGTKVLNALGAEIEGKGGDYTAVGADRADYRANAGALNQVEKDISSIVPYKEMLDKNAAVLEKLAVNISTDSPLFNKPINWLKKNAAGDPDTAELLAQVQIVQTEAARVLNNPRLTGQLTDSARHEMQSIMDGNFSMDQMLRVSRRLVADGENRVDALYRQRERNRAGSHSQQPSPTPGGGGSSDGWGKAEQVK